ncbi:MAG: hypothetical protein EOO59_21095 [Hymenobacter sp.]|nr:MAG: hypothetical protein EOO59_21095 [Hymenobacter sp.]
MKNEVFHLARSPYAAALLLAAIAEDELVLWAPTTPGREKKLLRVSLPPQLRGGAWAVFVGAGHVLVADGEAGALFQFTDTELWLLRSLPPTSRLVAALPTGSRQQFALLEANGRLTLHALAD